MLGLETILIGKTAEIIASFIRAEEDAKREKKTYTDKLEQAAGDDIFKYILLINVSALEGYIAQTRIQAQQSFNLSRIIAVIGFLLLAIAIGISVWATYRENTNLNAAYLASIAGILTEFVSGVFFYLYNKTLQQINLFHDRLVAMQQTSMSFLASSLVQDPAKKDQAKLDLSNALLQQSKTLQQANPAVQPTAKGGGRPRALEGTLKRGG